MISPSGEVTTFTNRMPEGIAVDPDGNIYMSMYENIIYRIDSFGNESLFAGSGIAGQTNGEGSVADCGDHIAWADVQ